MGILSSGARVLGDAAKALPGIGNAIAIGSLLADAVPLVKDIFSSPSVDQDKIDKLKTMRDNAASQLSGEMGVPYDKAVEMVDREFQPMIDEASQPQGGNSAGSIASDAVPLALGVAGFAGMKGAFKGASIAADAAKDSSGVLAADKALASQGPTDFKGAYDGGGFDTVKGVPGPGPRPSSVPPNAGGMRDYPGMTSERGLSVPPGPGPTGPINGEPVDAETTAALNRIMAARAAAGGQAPPNVGSVPRGFQMGPPAAIGMDGMTPELAQLLQEHQDMLRARGTPQGMQARMYANQGD